MSVKLPLGWASASLGEIATVNPKHPRDLPDSTEVSFVPMPAVDDETGTIQPHDQCAFGKVRRGYTHFADGDVIFAKITPCMQNGKAAVAKGLAGGRACGSTEFFVFRPSGAVEAELLHRYLRQPLFRAKAQDAMTGVVGQARVPRQFMEDHQLPVPPLNEQRRIVAKVESLFERSHRAKDALDAIPPLLNKLRQSILAAAFRGDLTADWRAQNPNVEPADKLLEQIRTERRHRWEQTELANMRAKGKEPKDDRWKEKYREPVQPSPARPEALPASWAWTTIEQTTTLLTDGEHQTPKRSDSGVYLLSARNVRNGRIDLSKVDYVPEDVHEQLSCRFRAQAGDVLLSCSGSVGRSCVVPEGLEFSMVRSAALLRPLGLLPDAMSLGLRSPHIQAQILQSQTQTAQANLFQGKIKMLTVPVPPQGEQEVLIRRVNDALAAVESLERRVSEQCSNLSKADSSILAKAFRGELVEQDPTDEPASMLLKRIRTAREAPKPVEKKRAKRRVGGKKSAEIDA